MLTLEVSSFTRHYQQRDKWLWVNVIYRFYIFEFQIILAKNEIRGKGTISSSMYFKNRIPVICRRSNDNLQFADRNVTSLGVFQLYHLYCVFDISLSKAFWRLLFYYLLFLAETFMMCVNVFYITRNEISAWSDKKMRNFPLDPHYNNCPLL